MVVIDTNIDSELMRAEPSAEVLAWMDYRVPRELFVTPGRYVGAARQEEDGEPFEDEINRLVTQLREQQAEGGRLDTTIGKNLELLGFGGQ